MCGGIFTTSNCFIDSLLLNVAVKKFQQSIKILVKMCGSKSATGAFIAAFRECKMKITVAVVLTITSK